MSAQRFLIVMAATEAVAGAALLAIPGAAIELVLGSKGPLPAILTIGRIAGAALAAICVACWMSRKCERNAAQQGVLSGVLIYNVAVALLLAWAGTVDSMSGVLLWPGVVIHAGLAGWGGVLLERPEWLKRLSVRRTAAVAAAGLLLLWLLVAYVIMPEGWNRYVRRHPALDDVPGITHTADGIPGDPINVSLIGTEAQLQQIMQAAKWFAADPLGLRSDLEIGVDTVLKRPDDKAPVSSLFLFGRKEDLAFEQPVGDSPRHRHHARFWRTDKLDPDGRPVWVGSAVYDKGVGLSHTTGQITHHTAADIDAERDYLFDDLAKTGELSEQYAVDDYHKVREGKNGGGDPWHTDGRLYVGVIAPSR